MMASLFVGGAIYYTHRENLKHLGFTNYIAFCEGKWKTINRDEVMKHKTLD